MDVPVVEESLAIMVQLKVIWLDRNVLENKITPQSVGFKILNNYERILDMKYLGKLILFFSVQMGFFLTNCAHANDDLNLKNLTGWDTKEIAHVLSERLPLEHLSGLRSGRHSLLIYSDYVSSEPIGTLCYFMIGVTGPSKANLNPRIPDTGLHSWNRIKTAKPSDEDLAKCIATAFLGAIDLLTAKTWKELEMEAYPDTNNDGGERIKEPEDWNTFSTNTNSSPTEHMAVKNATISVLEKTDFSLAFDYRKVAVVTKVNSAVIRGNAICHALSGLTMRPPHFRNARWPGFYESYFAWRTVKNGDVDSAVKAACADAAKNSVSILIRQPWNNEGILKNIVLTSESDLELVTRARHSNAASSKPKIPAR